MIRNVLVCFPRWVSVFEDVKLQVRRRKKILESIDQINQDIVKADQEIADIENKKSEFTNMIQEANEEIKKLEGQSMQGGRKKRRRKKRTKKKSLKRKRKRTRKKN